MPPRYSYNYYDYYEYIDDPIDSQYRDNTEVLTVIASSSFKVPCSSSNDTYLYHNKEEYLGSKVYNEFEQLYVIENADVEHNGVWMCGDDDDNDVTSIHVTVLPHTDNSQKRTWMIINKSLVESKDTLSVIDVEENDLLSAVCVTVGSQHESASNEITFKWRLDEDLMDDNDNIMVKLDEAGRIQYLSHLNLLRVSRLHHNQVLQCSSQVDHDDVQLIEVKLNVEFPPQFTISRDPLFGTPVIKLATVALRCHVDSNPESVISWEQDGVIVSNSSDLVILSASLEDRGWYQCNANHKLGNYSSVGYYLSVKESIMNTSLMIPCNSDLNPSSPIVITPNHNISSTSGQNVTLHSQYCIASGQVTIIWSGPRSVVRHGDHQDRYLSTTSSTMGSDNCTTSSLRIEKVDRLDTGWYTVLVSSESGVGQSRVWLEVSGDSEMLVTSSSVVTMTSVNYVMLVLSSLSLIHLIMKPLQSL